MQRHSAMFQRTNIRLIWKIHKFASFFLSFHRVSGFASYSLSRVEGAGKALGGLVKTLLEFAANHHAHHHIQFGMQHQTHTRVACGDFVELNPKAEIDGQTTVLFIALDFNMLIFNLFDHSQADGKALDLERACVLRRLPLLDLVGNRRCEQREVRDKRIYLRNGAQNLLLFRFVFFHF